MADRTPTILAVARAAHTLLARQTFSAPFTADFSLHPLPDLEDLATLRVGVSPDPAFTAERVGNGLWQEDYPVLVTLQRRLSRAQGGQTDPEETAQLEPLLYLAEEILRFLRATPLPGPEGPMAVPIEAKADPAWDAAALHASKLFSVTMAVTYRRMTEDA